MSFQEVTTRSFTEQLASPTSVPGGGGASALAAAIGIALGDMVGEFTVGKKKYADVEDEIKELMKKAQDLRAKLLEQIDKDAEAFEPLSRAYAIPKDDPSRDTVMEECLKQAAEVPMNILRLSCESLDILSAFAAKGSKMVISDAATGAAICRGALLGAAVNVKINTHSMKDKEYAAKLNYEVDDCIGRYAALADEIFAGVFSRYE